jgi:hypothetical protein
MNIRRLAVVSAVLSAATACASNGSSAYSSPQPTMSSDTPVHGATPVGTNTVMNSDNRPIQTRTGLNSDPDDPNGTSTPTTMPHYGY